MTDFSPLYQYHIESDPAGAHVRSLRPGIFASLSRHRYIPQSAAQSSLVSAASDSFSSSIV